MINLNKQNQRGKSDEKAKVSEKHNRTVDNSLTRRKEKKVSGEHSRSGKRLHGIRGRTRKPEDAERVSEESEEYSSTTRYIESSLGIKSYSELAPHLAKGVERVMASLLEQHPEELKITPEFIWGTTNGGRTPKLTFQEGKTHPLIPS